MTRLPGFSGGVSEGPLFHAGTKFLGFFIDHAIELAKVFCNAAADVLLGAAAVSTRVSGHAARGRGR